MQAQVQYRQQNCSTFDDLSGKFDYRPSETQKSHEIIGQRGRVNRKYEK